MIDSNLSEFRSKYQPFKHVEKVMSLHAKLARTLPDLAVALQPSFVKLCSGYASEPSLTLGNIICAPSSSVKAVGSFATPLTSVSTSLGLQPNDGYARLNF